MGPPPLASATHSSPLIEGNPPMKAGSKLVMKQMADKSNQDVETCVRACDPGAILACRNHMIHVDLSLKRLIKTIKLGLYQKRGPSGDVTKSIPSRFYERRRPTMHRNVSLIYNCLQYWVAEPEGFHKSSICKPTQNMSPCHVVHFPTFFSFMLIWGAGSKQKH